MAKATEALALTPKERLAQFSKMWEEAGPIVAKLVPRHVDPAHVFAVAMTARQRDPRLQECTDISVLRAAILSAQFGLDCSGIGGKAYMIPYYNKDLRQNEAHFQFGYRGLLELAMRTGKIAGLYAREVYEGEPFRYEDGLQQILNHVPSGAPNQEVIAAWAVAVHINGYRQPEVLFRHQIEARRAVSRAADGPAWTNWYPEMAKKTVLRLLCKKLPDSVELSRALDLEDRADIGLPPPQELELEALETPAEPPPTRTEKLKREIKSRKERGEEASEPEAPPAGDEPAASDPREPGEEG